MAQEHPATMAHQHPATSAKPEHLRGRYQLLKTIGEGNYGKVKLAKHLPTGAEVAVKIVNLNGTASLHRFLMREVKSMKALQHPNIVQLYEVIERKDTVFIVMEYASSGSMMDHLKSYGRIKEKEACGIFRKLLSAVYFCHQHGFVHRDIKPENIFFDSKMNPKIGDFGFSTEYSDRKLKTMCCSPSYAAPELYFGKEYEGPAADVWSLGITLYRMVAGHLPFKAQNWKKLGQQIIGGKYTVPYFFSFQLERFLKKMLTVKPENRGHLVDLMSDPWIRQDEEDLMLYSDPSNEIIDPLVERQIKELGFSSDDIQDALRRKDFNKITAAYLILKAKKHECRCRTIHVKPYNPTDQSPAPDGEVQSSCSSSRLTCDNDYALWQEGESPAAPSAHQQLWAATWAPTPRVIASKSSPDTRTVTPRSTLKRRTSTPVYSTRPSSNTPETSPEFRPVCHKIMPWWRTHAPITVLGSSSSSEVSFAATYGSSIPSDSSSSSGSSRETRNCWQRVARRCCNCFTQLCLRLSKKRRWRNNQVEPC